jgi:hypothetical protein
MTGYVNLVHQIYSLQVLYVFENLDQKLHVLINSETPSLYQLATELHVHYNSYFLDVKKTLTFCVMERLFQLIVLSSDTVKFMIE